jgi:hypothetical protein
MSIVGQVVLWRDNLWTLLPQEGVLRLASPSIVATKLSYLDMEQMRSSTISCTRQVSKLGVSITSWMRLLFISS